MKKKRTAGIIVATGYDTLGKMVSPLSPLGTSTIVKRILVTFQLADISPIIVITGFDGLSVERHLSGYGAVFFRMQDFMAIDLSTDVFPAIKYAADKSEQFVFAPVEYPLARTDTIQKLLCAKGAVRIPEFRGKRGCPLVMEADILSRCDEGRVSESRTLEEYLKNNQIPVTEIPVEDEGVLCSYSDEERCGRILENHDEQMLHPYVRLDIDYASKVFDPRMKMLLQQIQDTGSVKKACLRIAVSTGKAWEQINVLEEAIGIQVVKRHQGGSHGGSTELTEKGREYLKRYTKLEDDVRKYARERFGEIFDPGTEKSDPKANSS